jgi:hypothetical protein
MFSMRILSLHLFNGQFLFILRFLAEVALVFMLGGIVGSILGLGKVANGKEADSKNKSKHIK